MQLPKTYAQSFVLIPVISKIIAYYWSTYQPGQTEQERTGWTSDRTILNEHKTIHAEQRGDRA